jgi:hypothetical protein
VTEISVPVDVSQEPRHLGALGGRLWRGGLGVGVLAGLASVALALFGAEQWRSFFVAYLVSYAFFLSLALGALFLILIQHVTHAGWGVVVRRLAEGVAATLPWLAVLFVPVLFGLHDLYHWSRAEAVAADAVLAGKASYLNPTFFTVRWVVYFIVWVWLARYFVSRSIAQDANGDVELTVQMQRRAALGVVLYAFTVSFAAIDILMSLDPHWYSTMFGVYYFAGAVVGALAVIIVAAVLLQGAGLLGRVITREHYHDLGKLLFAFIVFWAYIAFSQYMLIWYGNIPEETEWYLRRQSNGWGWIGLVLVFGHFLLPFLALISRTPKRRKGLLAVAAGWMLGMHWVDVAWLVVPHFAPLSGAVSVETVTLLLAFAGLMVARFAQVLREPSLVPERDPRIAESLTFENA